MPRGHLLSSRVAACCERTRRTDRRRNLILFLAANLDGTSQLALDQEYAAIESELRMAPNREDFELCSRWAFGVDEMARHLMELQPTIIHFSGHGACSRPTNGGCASNTRDVAMAAPGNAGICLRGEHGEAQVVTAEAMATLIGSCVEAARLVVLNSCHSDAQVDELCAVVDCAIGMPRAIRDDGARSFSVGFYRALGNRRSVGQALEHAIATLKAKQLAYEHRPRVRTRKGVDVHQLVLPSTT